MSDISEILWGKGGGPPAPPPPRPPRSEQPPTAEDHAEDCRRAIKAIAVGESKTPITTELVFCVKGKTDWEAANAFMRQCLAFEEELAKWKSRFITFAVMHASIYGRDHYGDGCLHWTHYDMLKEAGARMDDFKRCGQP